MIKLYVLPGRFYFLTQTEKLAEGFQRLFRTMHLDERSVEDMKRRPARSSRL